MNVWKTASRLLLGPGGHRRLSVLVFHRVRCEKDPLRPNEASKHEFAAMMNFLASNFQLVGLRQGVTDLKRNRGPFHAVSVTFDDGYADNVEIALPIFRRYQIPATFFVCSGFLDGGLMWNDRIIEAIRGDNSGVLDLNSYGLGSFDISTIENKRKVWRQIVGALKYRPYSERNQLALEIQDTCRCELTTDLMMTTDQLRQLAEDPLAEIGGHTVTHPILSEMTDDEAQREISEGKEWLEAKTGVPVRCFAYPNGIPGKDFTYRHVAMVRKSGFELAVSTSPGGIKKDSDQFQLPRFTPWDRDNLRFGLRLLYVSRKAGDLAVKSSEYA